MVARYSGILEREAEMHRKLWIGLATAVAVLALGAVTAAAHTRSFDTELQVQQVTVTDGNVEATGDTLSPKLACERGRVVRLFAAEDNGTRDVRDDTFTLVDRDRTNLEGEWLVSGPYPAGTDYFLFHVEEKNTGQAGHQHVCEADTESFPVF
jgi:hypothetical protein